jgi:exopolysaccharide biosynthesis WecB/TagA/CpsF family protein
MDALNPPRRWLLGLAFDNLTLGETVEAIAMRPRHARFAYVVTPNADHLQRLKAIPALRLVYDTAWLCLLDSQLVSLCAATLGLQPPLVVTGADLTQALLDAAAGQTVAVVGLKAASFSALAARYPAIIFVHHEAPMGLLRDRAAFAAARDFVCAAPYPLTLLALGSPLQEMLAYAIFRAGSATGVGLCVGAAPEFCAGTARRAPVWMRRRGLEWLHRLARDPRRLARRYLWEDPGILVRLAREALDL